MGRISYFPTQKNEEVDIIQVAKDKIIINGVECETMGLEEFLMNMEISPEAEERFVRGLFGVVKDAIADDWKLMKMFREVFKK